MYNSIELALKWFKENGIKARSRGDSIYVIIGRDVHIQISDAEAFYRSELQGRVENEKLLEAMQPKDPERIAKVQAGLDYASAMADLKSREDAEGQLKNDFLMHIN